MIELTENQWSMILDALDFFREYSNPDYDYEKQFEEQKCIGERDIYTQQDVEDVSEIIVKWRKQHGA